MKLHGILLALLFVGAGMAGCSSDTDDQRQVGAWEPPEEKFDPDALQGRVLEYGVYRSLQPGQIVSAPDTNTGLAHRRSLLKLERTTNRIPLRKNVFFGFKSRIEPFPERRYVELKKVVSHPPMRLPDGTVTDGYELIERKKVNQKVSIGITGYAFDEDYEMVEGEWRFQYWYGDRLLVEQSFVTYRPEAGDEDH